MEHMWKSSGRQMRLQRTIVKLLRQEKTRRRPKAEDAFNGKAGTEIATPASKLQRRKRPTTLLRSSTGSTTEHKIALAAVLIA